MRLLHVLVAALLAPCQAYGQAVFAHFMLDNTQAFSIQDWERNIEQAKAANIDAFALNMAYAWPYQEQALTLAFQASRNKSFKLLFSFDYAGNGPWPKSTVIGLINQYRNDPAYYYYNGLPFVSTFEGPGNADDWHAIKGAAPCFFIPDWSSLGAKPALEAGGGVADGLFSWAAWPWGDQAMSTYVDASYLQVLRSPKDPNTERKPYMMPVSPWFYTNLPGYGKNWAWKGDTLWHTRWMNVFNIKPEFVQIISWNDFGESHYIGDLDSRQYEAFNIGNAPFNYVEGMPHSGLRDMLPWFIGTYKDERPAVDHDRMAIWYRPTPAGACPNGGTTENTATQLQLEFDPAAMFEDAIFVMAVLKGPGSLRVRNHDNPDTWAQLNWQQYGQPPDGGAGLYWAQVPMANFINTGRPMEFQVLRASGSSPKDDGFVAVSAGVAHKAGYDGLCSYACNFGFCPRAVCTCTETGALNLPPPEWAADGSSAAGDDAGLCRFSCRRGYCPQPCTYGSSPGFDHSTCKDPDCRALIRDEFTLAYDMAVAAREGFQGSAYFVALFPEVLRNRPGYTDTIQGRYDRIADMLTGVSANVQLKVSCNNETLMCKNGYFAHMRDKNDDMRVNICDRWFTDAANVDNPKRILSTANRLATCSTLGLREAHWSRAAILVHEMTHTRYALGKKSDDPNTAAGRTLDYAYGYNSCLKLARNQWDRSCATYANPEKPFCPDAQGKEGRCPQELSEMNADQYAFVAAGVYFSEKCKRAIPLPDVTTNAKAKRHWARVDRDGSLSNNRTVRVPDRGHSQPPAPAVARRALDCPLDDSIPLDGGNSPFTITGLAHFGDSYASGMGTGTTSGDSCRVGSRNYGELLLKYFDDPSIVYERHSCSGDTVEGLMQKIEQWSSMERTNVATLTIGGNDLGFSTLVDSCVVQFKFWRSYDKYREDCLNAQASAKALMRDGLADKLKQAYVRIMRKSAQAGQRNLHIYVSGYTPFFHEFTHECDQVSFSWWGASGPKLTQSLRNELNDLVRDLNGRIRYAISLANDELGISDQPQVHFVDMDQGQFNAHRWCEPGVSEPDGTRKATWFFLSGWPDVDEGQGDAASADSAELAQLVSRGNITLPNASTCGAALDAQAGGVDPYARFLCWAAEGIAAEPNGFIANKLSAANAAIATGNGLHSQDVGWWQPTRQIKTFHPRTPGMEAYRDAVLEIMALNGQEVD